MTWPPTVHQDVQDAITGRIPPGMTGAAAATRYVGGTASGAPTTGAFAVGDFVIDQSGTIWVCTVAGTPGTWVQSGSAAYVARAGGSADSLSVTGLTGSTAASRYVGATASGAPTTGAHLLGDWVIDQTGSQWVCTVAGTPGTWAQSGGGGGGFTKIAALTLGTNGPITFSSIPGTYKSLLLVISGSPTAAAFDDIILRFNGDTTAQYDSEYIRATGSTVTAAEVLAGTSIRAGLLGGGGSGQAVEILVPGYAETTHTKAVTYRSAGKNGTTTGNIATQTGAGFWRSTAAITSVTVDLAASTFNSTFTTATLYGLST